MRLRPTRNEPTIAELLAARAVGEAAMKYKLAHAASVAGIRAGIPPTKDGQARQQALEDEAHAAGERLKEAAILLPDSMNPAEDVRAHR